MAESGSEPEEVSDLSNPDVVTKYKEAATIANKALVGVISQCTDGADIASLCVAGDQIIEDEAGKLYRKKKKMVKGVAFPTCISRNDVVGHFSPLANESEQLVAGDLVKVDLACHIDGFIAAVAHTFVVGGGTEADEKIEDRRADVIAAAYHGAEAAIRLMQVGNTNTKVTEALAAAAAEFGCKPVHGVLSHQLKKHVIDGNRVILGCQTVEEKVEEFQFELDEVYCIDVVMSTGTGKSRESEKRHTVYKRAVEKRVGLKSQKARQFISEVARRFPALPFTLRAFEDATMARVGVTEAKRHELLEEYPVLQEKEGEFVAQFKFTVLIMPSGAQRVTGGLPWGDNVAPKPVEGDEDLRALLATPLATKKDKKKAKAKAKAAAAEAAPKAEGEAADAAEAKA